LHAARPISKNETKRRNYWNAGRRSWCLRRLQAGWDRSEPWAASKKKGRPVPERPKSREETPKEGCGKRARRSPAAPQYLAVHRTKSNCVFCRAAKTWARTLSCKLRRLRVVEGPTPEKKEAARSERPSLGRKRPRWAAISRDAPQDHSRSMQIFAIRHKIPR